MKIDGAIGITFGMNAKCSLGADREISVAPTSDLIKVLGIGNVPMVKRIGVHSGGLNEVDSTRKLIGATSPMPVNRPDRPQNAARLTHDSRQDHQDVVERMSPDGNSESSGHE